MNKNPLLVKSSLVGKIPFIKGKTLYLYGRYLSGHRFIKTMESGGKETLSAFTLGSNYGLRDTQDSNNPTPLEFVFDQVDITHSEFFSEKEWVALGMLLRAYKEVEGINLLHLYNCLYSGEKNVIRGHVVEGRAYTLYSSTQLPVKITLTDPLGVDKPLITRLRYLSKNSPLCLIPKLQDSATNERLLNIEIEFTGSNFQPSTLVEGLYKGASMGVLDNFNNSKKVDRLIVENLAPGEYSTRLVEFFAGTLITPLSDPGLKKYLGITTEGLYNSDGYIGKASKI